MPFIGLSLMKIYVDGMEKEITGPGCRVSDLLVEVGANREAVVVAVNGEITIEEAELKDGDSVRIIPAVSGG